MILGASRVKYVEFTSRCDLNSLQRCIVNAFSYFGGVPKEILTDNMKTVIVGRQAGRRYGTRGLKILRWISASLRRCARYVLRKQKARWNGSSIT